jgi:pimeloyl-ACP methyl ester carboxylesterase
MLHGVAARGAIVIFVHGVLGASKSTWTNGPSYWPSLLTTDSTFNDLDIFVYSYPTTMWATMSIDELAENMRLQLSANGISGYAHIIFLSHSMGGLITRAYLLKNRDVAERTLFLYFLSTPTTGSQVASFATFLSSNPQFGKMQPMNAEDYLADLVRQWLAADLKIPSYCAYEKRSTYVFEVVKMQSATALCTKALDPLDADHISIAKPSNLNADPYLAFKVAYMREMESLHKGQGRLASFIDVLRQRADTFIFALDEVMATLDKSNDIQPEDAKKTELNLQRIRGDFVELQKKHIDAVNAGDALLTHELVGQIHALQSDAISIVGSRVGTIGANWFAMLGRRYLDTPTPEEDPKYHATMRDVGRLREDTEERLQSSPYPGDAPASAPSDISVL